MMPPDFNDSNPMTKRDFLVLMIKVFGLSSAVTTIFSVLPSTLMFAVVRFEEIGASVIIWMIATSMITVGLFWILTFRADKLVDLLKLGQGFADERIEFGNLKSEDILKIGILVIGGLLFIRNVPGLLSNTYWVFKGDNAGMKFPDKDKVNLGISALNVILGYLLFTNYDVVARRIKGKREED
jgi:hypothetical protein